MRGMPEQVYGKDKSEELCQLEKDMEKLKDVRRELKKEVQSLLDLRDSLMRDQSNAGKGLPL